MLFGFQDRLVANSYLFLETVASVLPRQLQVSETAAYQAVWRETMLTDIELTHLMKVARPELTIVHPSLLTTVLEASQAAGINHSKIFQFSDRPTTSPQGSTPDLRSILPSLWEAESYDWLDLRGKAAQNTTAAINFSSGTTGLPKGVSISHHNMVANLEQVSFITKLDTQKATNGRWVGFLPMYHAYGQLYSCLMCVLLSNPVYIMTKFDFIDLMQTIQNYRLTTIHLVPREIDPSLVYNEV